MFDFFLQYYGKCEKYNTIKFLRSYYKCCRTVLGGGITNSISYVNNKGLLKNI